MSVEPTHPPVDESTSHDLAEDGQIVGGAPAAPLPSQEPPAEAPFASDTAAPAPAEPVEPATEPPPQSGMGTPLETPISAAAESQTPDAAPPTRAEDLEPLTDVAASVEEEAPKSAAKPKPKRAKAKAKDATPPEPRPTSDKMVWYVLKVQSNREDSIRDAILRRIKIAGLDSFVGDVVVPTEKVMEIKEGKKRVVKRKFYPGYIIIQMEMTDDVWFTIRDTPGVGHFVGSGDKPVPMADHEVAKMLGHQQEAAKVEQPKAKIPFAKGDRVTINEGPFENFEGDVEEINEDKGLVRVMIQIFGRPTPVDVEYWLASLVRN